MISRVIFVKMAPRFTSLAPFWRLIWDHLECPDIGLILCGQPFIRESNRWLQPAERIRNVAVTGHGGSGKTTLVERCSNLVVRTTRLGKVDDGTSILDTDPEEHKRRITINMALASFTHEARRSTPRHRASRLRRRPARRPPRRGCRDRSRRWFGGDPGGTQSVWDELEKTKTPGSSWSGASTARTRTSTTS